MTPPDLLSFPRVAGALARLYGDREPDYAWQTIERWDQGGPDPLDAILVFASDEGVPHWHYVGVGLSSLAARDEGEDDGRGWAFELTARLVRSDDELHPPGFMANVLQNLARYVVESGNALGPGHTMNLHGPIALGSSTPVEHVLFVLDPQLHDVDDDDEDALGFLQVVGLTADEVAAKKSWTAEGFSELFARHHPLLVTRIARRSILRDPDALAALEAGRARDGSSTAGMAVDPMDVRDTSSRIDRLRRRRELTVTIGADAVDTFCLLLPLRLEFGETFLLHGAGTSITFSPDGEMPTHEHEPSHWVLGLTPVQARRVAGELLPRRGSYPVVPGLVFEVRQTLVQDQRGDVVRTIG